ncbi:hypothetical protein J3R30DRAFT_3433401 [Lentinula aciculospora]|uniref:Uncharacterized protein n=1 Tax=Lentinula aciculospora TaxID=153920 RepID=A0A9W9AS89_9AGAR|nr:hypothetical protein J3R30DRAFT_3433401 [Lentinula aciculospora]
MAGYDTFADLPADLWSDLVQQSDVLDSSSFTHDFDEFLNEFSSLPTEIPDFLESAVLQLYFHQEFLPDSHVLHSDLEQNASVLRSASLNESVTVEENQIPSERQAKTLSELQFQSKTNPSDENGDDKMLVVDEASVTKINQAELEYAELFGNPNSASFLEYELGPVKWNIFSEKLIEKRKASKQQQPSSGIIDFLVKTEIIKEVFRKYLPPAYSEVNYAIHTWPGSPNGKVILTRATVFTLSGWSKVFFSYWSRRAEHLALFSIHDDRLRIISSEFERHLFGYGTPGTNSEMNFHNHLGAKIDTVMQSLVQITTRKLDTILKETKERTGLNPTKLRGRRSMLDAYMVIKHRFFASSQESHSTLLSGATSSLWNENDIRQYNPISSDRQTSLSKLSDPILVSSSNLRQNSRSAPGRSMFKLQHAVDPTPEAGKDQLEFQFEWELK